MQPLPLTSPLFLRLFVALTAFLISISIANASTTPLTISPDPLRFARVSVNHTKILQVKMKNPGSTSVTISNLVNVPGFSVGNLTLPLTLPAGKSMIFNITFAPTVAGLTKGNIRFENQSNVLLSLNVRGVGVLPWQLHANPSSLNFDTVAVGRTRTLPVALTNPGKSSITVSQDSIAPTGFSFSGLSLPVVIGPGQSFTFDVKFSARAMGAATGNMQVSNPTSPILRIPLSGTGVSGLSVSPGSADFGNVVRKTSSNQPGTLSASGAEVTISSASINNSAFFLSGLKFPVTVPVGQNVPFTVTFSPATAGPETGTLAFVSTAGNSPKEVLTGVGIPPYTVHLSWTASTSQVAGYNVYRRQDGGKYAKINSALVPDTKYIDKAVTTGTTYYYETKAVSASGAESAPSNRATAVIP
jgi:Abnormal spindle-like microcephaly-assoc'd, ASPM-SPD-2-Hydin